jgi:hypothetical protein
MTRVLVTAFRHAASWPLILLVLFPSLPISACGLPCHKVTHPELHACMLQCLCDSDVTSVVGMELQELSLKEQNTQCMCLHGLCVSALP